MSFKLSRHSTALVEALPAEPISSDQEVGFLSEQEQIAILAHSYWKERGCPEGSPEQDWFRAEEVIQLGKLAKNVGRETNSPELSRKISQPA